MVVVIIIVSILASVVGLNFMGADRERELQTEAERIALLIELARNEAVQRNESIEIDSFDPAALAHIRRSVATPIASCESLFGRRGFKPFFEHYAMDVAIIDAPWNGVLETMKIAAMAEAYEINVAPHNFYGHLSTMMNVHFAAAVPNLRIMEIDIDRLAFAVPRTKTTGARVRRWLGRGSAA